MIGGEKEFSQYKTNSEREIAKRRRYNDHQTWLGGKIKSENHMLYKAEWE